MNRVLRHLDTAVYATIEFRMFQHIGWDMSRRHVPLLAADFVLIPVNRNSLSSA
jgi:hypothetical protein